MADSIEVLVREFVSKVREAAHAEASASVESQMEAARAEFAKAAQILAGLGQTSPARKVGKKVAKKAPASKAKAKPGKRIRRSPEQIEEQAKQVLAFVKKKPSSKIDAISEATGLTVEELQTPISWLRSNKSITTKGTKRSTTYYPKG
jgi:hypothetical protein